MTPEEAVAILLACAIIGVICFAGGYFVGEATK
jgi:hypothetical protein